ncbi:hypothetical protein AGMMS49587_16740 [Spirochaetia bacterium]|nr:hypothetical protein AGMMS49587_16740 [Spirochaetia bacterium]
MILTACGGGGTAVCFVEETLAAGARAIIPAGTPVSVPLRPGAPKLTGSWEPLEGALTGAESVDIALGDIFIL